MRHHVVYWRMARREADVDDDGLAALFDEEGRGETYASSSWTACDVR